VIGGVVPDVHAERFGALRCPGSDTSRPIHTFEALRSLIALSRSCANITSRRLSQYPTPQPYVAARDWVNHSPQRCSSTGR
jgi:hypothetical protein